MRKLPEDKSKIGGYTGKLLWVDLDTQEYHTLSTYDYIDYIGGKAMGARLQWEFGDPTIEDGLDPNSLLMFLTGPWNGVPISGAGRITICFKQTVQKPSYWSHSSAGGWFAPELKYAGWDGIILRGKSENPVYIWIQDDKIEFRDAEDAWEMDTYETQDWVRNELGGDRRIRVGCLGPSGARKNRMSAIVFDTSHAAGQHPGAVMGAKNLKAIAVRGTGTIKVVDPKTVLEIRKIHKDVHEVIYGALGGLASCMRGIAGTKGPHQVKRAYSCFGCHYGMYSFMDTADFPRGGNICGHMMEYATAKYVHKGDLKWVRTPYGDATTVPNRFEFALWDPSLMEVVKLNDKYGISSYELAGMRTPNNLLNYMHFSEEVTPGFRDWLKQHIGEEYGTMEFARKYLRLIAYREGPVGELIGDGINRAAEKLRDFPERYNMTKRDGELAWEYYQRCYPIHDSFEHHFYRPTFADPRDDATRIRISPMSVFCYGIGSRQMGPNHHAVTEMYEEAQRNARGQYYAVFGDERASCRYLDANGDPVLHKQPYMDDPTKFYTLDGRESIPVKPNFTVGAPLAAKIALGLSLYNDSMVCCDFVWPLIVSGTVGSLHAFHLRKTQESLELMADPSRSSFPEFTARLFTAVTGIEKTKEEFLVDAWRALTVERAVHVRDNNRLPDEDQPNAITMDRPDAYGVTIDREEWRKGFGILYELMGWDPETGRPTEKGLHAYGLDEVAEELEKIGRLPHTDINLNLQAELEAEGKREHEKNHEYYEQAWQHMLETKGQLEIKAHY